MDLATRRYGAQSMTAPLQHVLVVAPRPEEAERWRDSGWKVPPDAGRLAAEHEAFRAELEAAGAEVVVAETSPATGLDAVYPYDPALVTDDGAVLLRPGKASRLGELDALAAALEQAGVPVAGRVEAPAAVEGGDTLWLDSATLVVGRSYRTNDAGIAALADLLPGVAVLPFDLPHHRGRAELLHLLSLISPLDDDLAVGYPHSCRSASSSCSGSSRSSSSKCPTRSS